MLVGAEESVRLVRIHRGTIEEAQYAAHFLIQLLGRIFALLYTFYIRCGEIVIVVGIAGSPRESVGPGAKLHVKPILYGLVGIVGSTPVAHHYAVKLPVALQYLIECPLVVAVVFILVQVVSTHDGPCLALLYGGLEGWQINLVQGAVAHLHIYQVAIFLIVVQAVMLDAG